MDARHTEAIRQTLQSLINLLGRDDVGVGEVVGEGETVHFTLAKGRFTQAGSIPRDLLGDRQELIRRLNSLVIILSTHIEQTHIRRHRWGGAARYRA
jgi:hypothetical protein